MVANIASSWALILIICCQSHAGVLSVRDYGAAGDGITDDTAAFQKALDEAGETPGTKVTVPVGRFLIKGSLSVPPGVTLEGVWQAPTAFTENHGSTILAVGGAGDENGAPLITMAHNSTLKGLTIFYPDQKREDAPPVPYPWTIRAGPGDNITVLDILAVNPYKLLDLTGADRHLVRGVYGQPLRLGIRVDAIYDLGRIEDCHLWPFFTRWWEQSSRLHRWMMDNAMAFEFARAEWQYVHNTFCFGYSVGYRFTSSNAGSPNGNFSGLGADCCRRPVLVETVGPGGGLLITNAQLVGAWQYQDSVGIEIAPGAKGKVSLSNSALWGALDRCVWLRSADAQFTATAVEFGSFDAAAVSSPAVQADSGRIILNGNTFGEGSIHVRLGAGVRSAVLMGNQAAGGLVVEDGTGGRTQMVANDPLPAPLPEQALTNYRVVVGGESDSRFLRRFHARETLPPSFGKE